ncbi:MAG: DUF2461 domain-containing protein, partial [Bacteroidota bacterium]
MITPNTLSFLKDIAANNNRDWFESNKHLYLEAQENVKSFVAQVHEELDKTDLIESDKIYRIYRDVRFSKDKTPYKNYFGGYFKRAGANRRGGYFFSIEPDNTHIGGGFYGPN